MGATPRFGILSGFQVHSCGNKKTGHAV